MEEDKIPTAEELEISGHYDSYQSMAIAFAQMHVKRAIQKIQDNAKVLRDGEEPQDLYEHHSNESITLYCVDYNSIEDAYPLENIK